MDDSLLQAYKDIETKIYVRSEKNKKLDGLIKSIEIGERVLMLVDVLCLVDSLLDTNTTIRYPFFLRVIYPVLLKGVEDKNVDAIKQLIKLFSYYGNFQNLTNDTKYNIWSLLMKGLQLSPFDQELLTIYESRQGNYFEYTLHELPSGVLYGSDGATVEQCDKLLKDLAEYEEVCKKLNIDRKGLISDCKVYYNSYKSYLLVHKNYDGFADYLEQHGIANK